MPLPDNSSAHLVLFLSNGGSLCAWENSNILSREIALYQEFIRSGHLQKVTIFSYDNADHEYLLKARRDDPLFDNIDILTPPAWMGNLKGVAAALYSFYGVIAHRDALRKADWFKTNQMSGAWAAVFSKWITGNRLFLRQGYSLSRRFSKNGQAFKARLARMVETISYRMADVIGVTSEGIARNISSTTTFAAKVRLFPTYIDTSVFVPKEDYHFNEPVLYVGRLEPQKNLEALVRGCRLAGRAIDMVGSGSIEDDIRKIADEPGSPVRLLGSFPNDELPRILNDHSVFALTSHHEGLPKVLIEAMGCGLVCVGSPIPGITDLIEDGKNGYLTEDLSAEEISKTISRSFRDAKAEIGRAARAKIAEHYNLEKYAREEAKLYVSQVL